MKSTFNIKRWIAVSLFSLGLFSSYTKVVYTLGRVTQSGRTGIELQKEFSLLINSLQNEEHDKIENEIQLNRIYLVKTPQNSLPRNNMVLYHIRQLTDNPFDTRKVGELVSNQETIEVSQPISDLLEKIKDSLPEISNNFQLIEQVYAQTKFQWNGYERNYNFYEEYIDEFTIRRYYNDGAVLEYRINRQSSSIPESFRWIETV